MVCDFIATLKMGRLCDFVCIFLYVVPVDVIPVAFAEKKYFCSLDLHKLPSLFKYLCKAVCITSVDVVVVCPLNI